VARDTARAASPSAEYVAVARVLAPHGIRGELKCAVLTDYPRRFASTTRVYLGPQRQPFAVQRARLQGRFVLLKLEGLEARDDADHWRNAIVQVPGAERVRLPRGHYFWEEVIGLEVRDEEGTRLGRVRDILQTGANDVYVVDTEPGELLVPAIKDVVMRIDPAKGEMTIHLLEGMR
jgi:16S rRNA processing protein RimM